MADTKISALSAVTTAADTDEYATNQGGVSKRTTRAVLFTNPLLPSYFDGSAIANPAAPGADTLRVWVRKVSGRILLKGMSSAGVDYPYQPALFGSQIQQVSPATGTTAGVFIGGSLTSAGTVSHPTPTSTSRATAMRRIRHANVVTTTNQVLGFHGGAADMAAYWRGNASGLGGFFFFARFSTALWAANTCRIFVGLRSGTTAVVASDTLAGHLCGFWHDTTVGGTTINFVTRDGTTANTTAITVPTLAADVGFDAYIYCPPNGSTIYYRLDSINDQTTRVDSSTSTNLPGSTTFMAPECAMSNGTANTTVTTVAIGTNKVYIESDY
jgi:hypothetical protein